MPDSLDAIALKTGTDKSSQHLGYTNIYELELQHLKDSKFNLLELGVAAGKSLLLWKEYFKKALIVGVDLLNLISNKVPGILDDRCLLEMGDQADPIFLTNISNKYSGFDVIIDDASHLSSKTIKSFEILFPLLNPGGIYIIEDLGVFSPASQRNEFADLGSNKTTLDFLFDLIKEKNNNWFYHKRNEATSYYYKTIDKIVFYTLICFIFKSKNKIEQIYQEDEKEIRTLEYWSHHT